MDKEDTYIIELLANIAESHDSKVLSYLIKLEKYLDTLIEAEEISLAMNTIAQTNLLDLILTEIKRDFSFVEPSSWINGLSLVKVAFQFISQSIPRDEKEEDKFNRHIFPTFVNNVLYFSRLMENHYEQSLAPNYSGILSSTEILTQFKKTIDILKSFSVRFSEHVNLIFQSNWFLQIFITNNEDVSILMTELVHSIVVSNNRCIRTMKSITEKGIGDILMVIIDEIIYHLSMSIKINLGESHLKCLLTLLRNDSTLITVLQRRYKGLKLLILRWSMVEGQSSLKGTTSNSCKADISTLVQMIDQGYIMKSDFMLNIKEIIRIQAWWRGALSRRKMCRIKKSVGSFQNQYRVRKQKEKRDVLNRRIEKERNYQLQLNRSKCYRAKLEREAELMEALSAPLAKKYLEKTRYDAAVSIQSAWKGFKERRHLMDRKYVGRRWRAALIIQRQFRGWMSRRELVDKEGMYKEIPGFSSGIPPGLDSNCKVELMRQINRWLACHKHQFSHKTDEEMLVLHNKARGAFRRYMLSAKDIRRQEMKRDALIAQMQNDAKMLLESPQELTNTVFDNGYISNRVDGDGNVQHRLKLENYQCRIRPFANRAQQMHNANMKMMNVSWWKKLALEDEVAFVDEFD